MKSVLGNLLLLLGGVVLALLALEAALRLAGVTPTFVTADPVVGYRFIPRARYRWSAEGFSEGRMNRDGWRDRDYSRAKPPGTTRILFCGDSWVEALQVPLDSTFHKRLERDLDARALPGRRFEVPALGESGWGTTQEYLAYQTWGRLYDPDIVAVLFSLNDWSDNWPWNLHAADRPYFTEVGDSLKLDSSFLRARPRGAAAVLARLERRSSLLTLVAQLRRGGRARFRPLPAEAGLARDRGWYYGWNFKAQPPADSIPAFRLTARILTRFARQVRQDGRRFVVFVAGAAEQEDRGLLAGSRHDPSFAADKPQRWLAEVGARGGFEVVPLSPEFRARSAADGRPLWAVRPAGFGHWNSAGHALAAQVMARYFEDRLPGLRAIPEEPRPGARRAP